MTAATGLVHDALFYDDPAGFVDGACDFVRAGLVAGEAVFVAVPGAHVERLREGLGEDAHAVAFADMRELGRNPGRIIPAVQGWVDDQPTGRVRFVGEPIWPGRRDCEAVEGARHEALINAAFADVDVSILCPYDTSRLPAAVIADAARTHPTVVEHGHRRTSPDYADPTDFYRGARTMLSPAPGVPDTVPITTQIGAFRRAVRDRAEHAGLAGDRLDDYLLAVNEAATNSVLHGGGEGTARLWEEDGHLVCEIADRGVVRDPLAGRRRPDLVHDHGRGLWLINQLCDLVELHPGPPSLTLRLHMRLADAA